MNKDKVRIVLTALGLLILIFGYSLIRTYFFEGKLIITSAPGAKISILGDSEKKMGIGKATTHLSSGRYLIQSSKDDAITRTTVTVKVRKTTSVSLDITALKTSSIVVKDETARSINGLADKSFTFLNVPYHQLFKYSPGKNYPVRYLPDLYPIKQVDWLENGGAVININDALSYLDSSGEVQNLGLVSSTYAVSKVGSIAYITNGDLMLTPINFLPRKILHLPAGGYSLSTNKDAQYVFGYSGIGNADSTVASSGFNNYIWSTEASDHVIKIPTDSAVISAMWSPDNQLAYTIGPMIYLYSMPTGQQQIIISSSGKVPVWTLGFLDGDNLIYAQDSSIWRLNVKTGKSYKLNSYQGSISPASLSSTDGSLYYSTDIDTNGNGGNIYNVSL